METIAFESISKIAGYLVILSSSTGKVPQIYNVLKNRSVEGLSLMAFELELIGYTICLAYCIHKKLPFSAFGEYLFLASQAIILVSIIHLYSNSDKRKTWKRALTYFLMATVLFVGQVDPILFEALYAAPHVIFLSAKVHQILKNYKRKGTGQLSSITSTLSFSRSTVRVFTSIHGKAPISMILGFIMGVVMNGTILSQILIYRKAAAKKEKNM